MKKSNFSILILLVLFVLLIVVEYNQPTPVDWKVTCSKDDKIPYGTYILHNELSSIFPTSNIQSVYQPIYNQLIDNDLDIANYIFVNNTLNTDKLDISELLEFAERGNQIFMSCNIWPKAWQDTLSFRLQKRYVGNWKLTDDDMFAKNGVNFVHKNLKTDSAYVFKKQTHDAFFHDFGNPNTLILGINEEKEANFIRIAFGKGYFYLHANPLFFTNYHLLDEKSIEYAAKVFSHLPQNKNIFWDEYYKVGRKEAKSPLRYVITMPALRWALYLSIVGMILFMLFESKRKQRIIPIVERPKNTSLEFAKTLGLLYYQNADHKDLTDTKISYLFEYIRTKLFIRKIEFTDLFYQQLAQKTGLEIAFVRQLFERISYTKASLTISEHDLIKLNNMIELFYQKNN